jgi:hypothetical protein
LTAIGVSELWTGTYPNTISMRPKGRTLRPFRSFPKADALNVVRAGARTIKLAFRGLPQYGLPRWQWQKRSPAKFRDNAGSILIQDHDKLPGVVSVKRAD